MLQRKRCVPFRRAAYVGGGIKMRPNAEQVPWSLTGSSNSPSNELPVGRGQWQTHVVAATDNGRWATANFRIKVAVLGVGSLGREHARIYAELATAGLAEFAGVYDAA